MIHIFRFGPIEIGDAPEAVAMFAIEGTQLHHIAIAPTAERALDEIQQRCRGQPLSLEPGLALLAEERDLLSAPFSEELLTERAMLAIAMAHGMPKPHLLEVFPMLIDAAEHLVDRAVWDRIDSDTPLLVEIDGRRYEASVLGNGGENFGVVLYLEPGGFARMLEACDDPEQATRIPTLSLNLEEEPEYAAAALEDVGVMFVPMVMRVQNGRPLEPTADELVTLAAATRAIAELGVERQRALVEVRDPHDRLVHAVATVPRTLPFVPELIAGGKGKVGRNDPCPCGSGKKYKKCCLEKEAPRSDSDRAKAFHALDRRLVEDMLRYSERCWPGWLAEVRRSFGGATDPLEEPLLATLALYDSETPEGGIAAGEFMVERGGTLDPRATPWIVAQIAARLSIWEALEIRPGEGMELRDLLCGGRTYVHEVSATEGLRPRTAMLARVVEVDGIAVLAGAHPRPLGPAEAERVVAEVRKKLGLRAGENDPLRLEESGAAKVVLEAWRRGSAQPEPGRARPGELRNTDEDPFVLTEDHFHVLDRAATRAALLALEGAEEEDAGRVVEISIAKPGNAIHPDWQNTLIASATLEERELTVTTNSVRRADTLRAALDGKPAALRFKARVHPTVLSELPSGEQLRLDAQRITGGPETAARMARDHYRRWMDRPEEKLGGKTPRQASAHARLRKKLDVILKEIEHAAPPGSALGAWLRAELGLSADGEKETAGRGGARGSKMSDTLADFADPMLGEEAPKELAGFERLMALAVEIWNAEVCAEAGSPPPSGVDPNDDHPRANEALRVRWEARLRERRKALFAGDDRFIGSWQAQKTGMGFSLMAAFAPIGRVAGAPGAAPKRPKRSSHRP